MVTTDTRKVFRNVDWQKMLAGDERYFDEYGKRFVTANSRNILGFPIQLSNQDFSGFLFEDCTLDWATFRKCNFTNAVFNRVSFVGARLLNCDFSCATFTNCVMDRTGFQSCSLVGTKMIEVTASDSVDFVDCVRPKGCWARLFGICSQMEKRGFSPGQPFQRNQNGNTLAAATKGVVFHPSLQNFYRLMRASSSTFFVATLEDLEVDFFLSESGDPLYIPFSKETKDADAFLRFYDLVSE